MISEGQPEGVLEGLGDAPGLGAGGVGCGLGFGLVLGCSMLVEVDRGSGRLVVRR